MKLDADTANTIGLWVIRILLVIGAIIALLTDHNYAAFIMACVVLLTFSL
jgi:hypothetical protein